MYLLDIIQPQRQCVIIQLGGYNTGNRRGIIRTQHQQSAIPVGELVHFFLANGGTCLYKHIIIFQRRGNNLVISPLFQHIADSSLILSEQPCCGKQPIPAALRR